MYSYVCIYVCTQIILLHMSYIKAHAYVQIAPIMHMSFVNNFYKIRILAPNLGIIFNYSLNTGAVPSNWKMANVTPLFKKGDHSQPNNYQSISLTSIVSKLLKLILSSNIRRHLVTHNILYHHQHEFRQCHSCESVNLISSRSYLKKL